MSEQKMFALRRRSDKVLSFVSRDKDDVKGLTLRIALGGKFSGRGQPRIRMGGNIERKRHRACDSRVQAARCVD